MSAINKLLQERYFLSNESTWEDLATRVGEVYPDAIDLIKQKKFIPSTPTLMNCNTKGKRKGGLSSCFVMGIEDSIEGIFDSLKEAAIVTKNAGGVGYDFSGIRSENEEISTLDGRLSSGPLPFMDMFNSMLDGIRQGGARKGAGMAQIDIDHPSILSFIDAKKDWKTQRLNRFNLSVRIPDWFYTALEETPDLPMVVKNVKDNKSYDLKDFDGHTVTYKELWDKIIKLAHHSAEPGILNSTIMFNQCSVTNYDKNVGTNPCSEFANIRYSSCNLGSLNLSLYVNSDGTFNFKELGKDIEIATRFLNNIIDINEFPIKNIERVTKAIRPIGLGVMGVAHMFMKMGLAFNSKEAHRFAKKLMTYITIKSMKTSCDIAKVDGHYEAFDFETFYNANKRFWKSDILENGKILEIDVNELVEDIRKFGTRNSCFTSIAPTGSISFIANTSGGIESIFALAFSRKIEKDKDKDNNIVYEYVYITDPIFDEWLDKNKPDNKEKILKYVSENKGSVQGCEFLTKEEQSLFLNANDLSSMEHLDALEPWAVATSLSVSKTVNLPESAVPKDIADVYIEAHKRGIIGVSVYRDNSRGGVLVHENDSDTTSGRESNIIIKTNAPKRPDELVSQLHTFTINKQNYYVVIGFLKNDPYEVFAGVNHTNDGEIYIPKNIKSGTTKKLKRGQYEFVTDTGESYVLADNYNDETAAALTRAISMGLRHGVDPEIIVTQLEKTKGMNNFAKAISRMLKKYIADGTKVHGIDCPNCGSSNMVRKEGCKTCLECGFSLCS